MRISIMGIKKSLEKVRNLEDRFWEKVDKRSDNECWNWIGSLNKGYGQLRVGGRKGKPENASRISWELYNGTIPEGMEVCHHCDNPSCVNPIHLFLGSHLANMKDCSIKGRMHFGEKNGAYTHPESVPKGDEHWLRKNPERAMHGETHPNSKLTAENVREIKRLYKPYSRYNTTTLSKMYGVDPKLIWYIIKGLRWNHIK